MPVLPTTALLQARQLPCFPTSLPPTPHVHLDSPFPVSFSCLNFFEKLSESLGSHPSPKYRLNLPISLCKDPPTEMWSSPALSVKGLSEEWWVGDRGVGSACLILEENPKNPHRSGELCEQQTIICWDCSVPGGQGDRIWIPGGGKKWW